MNQKRKLKKDRGFNWDLRESNISKILNVLKTKILISVYLQTSVV